MNETSATVPYLVGERGGFRWYHVEDVKGPGLGALAAQFGLHELAVEDCRTGGTRAKLEEYDGHFFLVVNTLHFDSEKLECWFGEFDVFFGKDFLVTVHDGPSRTAAAVRPHFASDAKLGQPARLLHALLRVITARYLPVLDNIEERIDELEERAYAQPTPKVLADIFCVKRALIEFRRVTTTMREVLNLLLSRNEPWLRSQHAYFRDIYDQVLRAVEFVDTYRDILTGVLEVHLSSTANRTNEIMKVLTVYATLAIPFVIVTGIYGMNVAGLPLAEHPHGAAWIFGGLVAASALILWFFRRKGWI
jgi:magnesium transporter